ncbi:vitamin K epoxide reductase family protein [Williamsia phyllosphaerae]|uniref:Vitamin K epoxide reductase domain-containing protein n=1 Tax=Williamsia phyllosphaerae TaxID=885042 RepID=A0ABQ1UGR9_9NOCA|nr:vitamin K epoxide reductase family protein [Williamsia phyllosphaerae]GGF17661.1 hypothetical protein GCM10007298_12090 [Williamsia phyllosphaerae]
MTLTDADHGPDPAVDDDIEQPDWAPGRVTGLIILIAGAIGLVAAATLTIEKFKLLEDPSYRPSCSINPVLSCGSVMSTEQAQFFGFPNPLIGIAAFAIVVVTGVLVVARVALPVWYWIGLTLGMTAGMVFVFYLITESIYRINALCPYCMVVWTITPILFVVAAQTAARLSSVPALWRVVGWLWPVLVIYYVVVILLIAEHFWYYWSTLI